MRERMNPKEPINDALPGQPLTAFPMIHEIINKFPATSVKANREAVSG